MSDRGTFSSGVPMAPLTLDSLQATAADLERLRGPALRPTVYLDADGGFVAAIVEDPASGAIYVEACDRATADKIRAAFGTPEPGSMFMPGVRVRP